MGNLDDRYPGPSRTGRVLLTALVAVVAAIGLGWLGWTAWQRSHPAVVARVSAFQVESDTLAHATLTVDRRDGRVPVRCFVFAQAKSFERVGEKWVDLGVGSRLTDVPVDLRTFARATSVSVDRCELAR